MEEIIKENVFNAYSEEITKQKCKKSAAISIIFLLIGMALMTGTSVFIEDSSSTLYMLLMITSIIIALYGLFRFLFGGKIYIYRPTNSKVRLHSIFFRPEAAGEIIPALEKGDLSFIDSMESSGNAPVKLEILLSDDGNFAGCQEFRYIPYCYEPVGKVARLSDTAIGCMLKYIEHHREIKA